MGPKKGSPGSKKGSPNSKKSKSGSPKTKSGGAEGKGKKRWPDNEEEEGEVELTMTVPEGIMLHRMRFTLQGEIEADVEFVVGPEEYATTIKANKCVLQSQSPVFAKIFERCEVWKSSETGKLKEIRETFLNEAKKVELTEAGKKSPGKKGSPDKSKKGSPDKKKKGSPDKSKKDSPDKSKKGSKKESPDKKSSGKKGKDSPKKGKDSPKKGKDSPKKGESENTVDDNFLEDEIYGWDQVRIKDIKAEGFYKLLRYIYYDEILFSGVISTIRTLNAARKYKFPDLRKACILYLENNVCIEYVLKILQIAFDLKEERMKYLCLQLLVNETYEVLNRQEFVDISHELLDFILKQDILNIRELELFQRVQHWAAHKCRNLGLVVSPLNERAMLGVETHNMIRYPSLLPHEFATIGINSQYLKHDEILTILTYYITCRPPKVPFSIQPRRRPCLDLNIMETESITFSDQTDLTFLGYKIRRCHSFKDITIPVGVLPPIKNVGLLPRLNRQTSVPADLNIEDDLRLKVIDNMNLLKDMDLENRRFEFAKDHLVLLRKHYR